MTMMVIIILTLILVRLLLVIVIVIVIIIIIITTTTTIRLSHPPCPGPAVRAGAAALDHRRGELLPGHHQRRQPGDNVDDSLLMQMLLVAPTRSVCITSGHH
jgi:hypothetical protein